METFSRSQILQEFYSQCEQLGANSNRGFKQEFRELNEIGKDLPTTVAELEANKEKNRYPYILPFDHSRVRLSIQNQNPYSDYINANFVPGGGSERDFICTQGPLPNTMAHFWRMVWEQNVKIIVMVTALKYKDTVLCDKYWSLKQGTVYHGQFQVTTVNRKQGPDYFITTINLRQVDIQSNRTITHYHYLSWPDQGVPKSSALCAFTEHVRQHLDAIPRLGPAVVHCSAGVGRSGTFVTLMWLMQLCVRGIRPDIRAAVKDLRLHRMWMVQTLEQYMFIYQSLAHWLSGGASARLQIPRISLNSQQLIKDQPHTSTEKVDGARRRRHRRSQTPSSDQALPTIKTLNPRNLIRRLMPFLSPNNQLSSNF